MKLLSPRDFKWRSLGWLVSLASLSVCFLSLPCFADDLKGYPKSTWGLEDVYVTGYPPNVLLLIDTGSPMLWTPQGKMPTEKVRFNSTPLSQCTYGDGSRPANRWGGRDKRYGRDLDPTNNDIYDEDNYYNNLIFRESRYSLENPKPGYTPDDLMPNDSRFYKLKLVLWRLLGNEALMKDINLGLATFWQENRPEGVWADWYKVPPYKGGPDWAIEDYRSIGQYTCYRDSQNVCWGVMITDYDRGSQKANKARLRIPIQNTNSSSVVEEIKKLIDGEESSDNDELRADGKAPLARSVYSDSVSLSSNGRDGTAWHFFNNTTMGGICQTNWLVILTAGDDNIGGESPVESVKKLYAKKLKKDGAELEYPIRTLVIGFVDPNDDSEDVVNLRATLNKMAFYGSDGGYDDSGNAREYVAPPEGGNYALFANDVPGLIQGFTRVFATIQSGRFSSNAPIATRIPGPDEQFSAIVPYYTRKGEGQWHGEVTKQDMETGLVLWSAESQLPTPANRNIYSVTWDDSDGVPDTGVNNLSAFKPEGTASNVSAFSMEMGFGRSNPNKHKERNRNLNDFIGWLRGYKEYGYGDQTRREHVLSDMEHSGLSLVTPPQGSYTNKDYLAFKEDHKDRPSSVYIQSNSGMLHCFDEKTGVERWAFVPPNVLSSYRISSLRFSVTPGQNINQTIPYASDERSLSLNLLDGPIAVGDVRDSNGDYITVLVGFLGRGGAGMYSMDITDPERPKFLWALENVFDVNNNSEKKFRWTKKDSPLDLGVNFEVINKNADPDFNLLGFTVTGSPAMGMIVAANGDEIPVFILSGGVGLKKDSPIGKAIYIVNVLTGEIYHSFTTSATVLSPSMAYSTRMRDRFIEGFFCSDANGSILQGITEGVPSLETLWELSCPSAREGFSFDSLVNPLPLSVGLIKNDIWVFGGTSGMSLAEDNGFENTVNILFSINSRRAKKTTGFKDLGNSDVGVLLDSDESISGGNIGWFMPLSEVSSERGQEYATTSPLMSHGVFFVATYQKDLKEDACSANGFAHLYVLDPTTGRGFWNKGGRKKLTFEGLKIAGISVAEGKLILSVKKMKPFTKPTDDDIKDVKITEKGDLIEIALDSLSLPEQPVGSRIPKMLYWRDMFFR